MPYLFSAKIPKSLVVLIVSLSVLTQAKPVKKQRFVSLRGCQMISALQYECCANVNLASAPQNDYCVDIDLVPNELTLNLDLKINGETFYSGQIDPSIAPICPPPSPLCLRVNHVNIANRQVCSKLTVGPFTLLKFPCVGVQDGQLTAQENIYVRK